MSTKLSAFSLGVFNDINKIRQDPHSAVRRFQNLKIVYSRLKGTQNLQAEIQILLNIIEDAPSIKPLTLSEPLVLAAQKQIENYEKEQFTTTVNKQELEIRCSEFCFGWTKLFQVSDNRGDEPIDTVNRLVNKTADTEKIARKILLDNTLNYIGVAHKQIGEENYVVIIVADEIKIREKKSTVDGFYEYINSVRTQPQEHVSSFEKYSEAYKSRKAVSQEAKNVASALSNMKPLESLHRNDIMNDLAGLTADNLDKFKSQEDFKNYFSNTHTFKELVYYVNTGELSGEKIGIELLLDPENRKIFLQNSKFNIIGIHQMNVNSKITTVIVIADNIELSGEESFGDKFCNVLNSIRKNPSSHFDEFKASRNKIQLNFPSSKKEFLNDLDNFISSLSKNKNEIPSITLNEGLTTAAEEYLDHLESHGEKKFYPQDDEYLKISLLHYIQGFNQYQEFIQVGEIRVENILLDLLFSEKDPLRKSRKALLDSKLLFGGFAQRPIRGQRVTVLILTDKADALAVPNFTEGIYQEINNMRAHPKSYVKYIQRMIDEPVYPKELKSKNQKDGYIQELSVLKEFLRTNKSLGPFAHDRNLTTAAISKLIEMDGNKISYQKKIVTDELKLFLSDYGSNFREFTQFHMTDIGEISPKEFLIKLLVKNPDNKLDIFSRKLNFIGVAHGMEIPEEKENISNGIKENTRYANDEDNETEARPLTDSTILLLVDKFEPVRDNNILKTYDKSIIIQRPGFTDDELLQMHKDFKSFDVLNTGFIRPDNLLLFINKTPEFNQKNPLYYEAINLLNTEENNSNGVDVEEFINAVANVIELFNKDNRWYELFSIYHSGNKKKVIDFEAIRKVAEQLDYQISYDELMEVLEKLSDTSVINQDNFVQIMNIAENTISRKKN